MKTLLFFLAAVLCINTCFAKKIRVKVSNFQFNAATVNAKVGDTIVWVWVNGRHTTRSLTIPTGATAWMAPINMNHKQFMYVLRKKGTYKYDCSIHPTLMKGTINVTAALGLSDLEITANNTNAVLSWQINSNIDVAYFSVQRSTDSSNFTEIARVQPSASNAYKYKDASVLTDKYIYYQVQVTDKKGNTQLSDIKMFTNTQSVSKLITNLSPNPISSPGHLMLQFNADADGTMKVQLFTQTGKLINQTEMTATKGLNNGHVHLGDLTPGTYYIVCALGNKTEKHTIIYQ